MCPVLRVWSSFIIVVIMVSVGSSIVSVGCVSAFRVGSKRVGLASLTLPSRRFASPFPHPSCTSLSENELCRTDRLISFLDNSPDPFHAVKSVSQRLVDSGFQRLREDVNWQSQYSLRPGGKYFFDREGSSLVAFVVGRNFRPESAHFKVAVAHTDSPNLRIKPKSKRGTHSGVTQLNVECYGGGLWHTWFDRDLSISGRVIVRNSSDSADYHTKLVKIANPVVRIPNLCIHLRSSDEREVLRINKEEHLQPILCESVTQTLTGPSRGGEEQTGTWGAAQEPQLLALLAYELSCRPEDIVDFELSLFDAHGATRSGMFSEFLCSARLDNLASCFAITESFIEYSSNDSALEDDEGISVVAFFDHEEVGSDSMTGAGSTLISESMERLLGLLHRGEPQSWSTSNELIRIAKAKSFIMSVDMAHAVHPNYASKHERHHSPLMNQGLVIKTNSNQRYATNGVTGFLTRELGRAANVSLQEFAVRNDCPCGSTVGPILSTSTGIRAVDVGMPQLSMHSIREMMGCKDLTSAHKLFYTFFKDFAKIDKSLKK